MKRIIFTLPGNEELAAKISEGLELERGGLVTRSFPDGETYIQLKSDVKNKEVIIVCSLYHPDEKLLPLYFLSRLLKDSGAQRIILVASYLGYMRQDKQFKPGEAVTSGYFACLISQFIDELVTIDPHLHRYISISDIYPIPCKVLHASQLIARWIKTNVEQPILIGPDSESRQWVSEVAGDAGAPYIILEKHRSGDREVQISLPDVDKYAGYTPVLIDDIISTAETMIRTVKHLADAGMKPAVCIGVHAIFAGDAYQRLKAIAGSIVTCNTVSHLSNKIDVSALLAGAITSTKQEPTKL
jgi:ribose-phosphate pyrophosphokinase